MLVKTRVTGAAVARNEPHAAEALRTWFVRCLKDAHFAMDVSSGCHQGFVAFAGSLLTG